MGNLREHDVHSAVIAQLGFMPGAVHYAGKGSGVPYGFLRDDRRIPASRLHTSIVDAYDAAGRQNGNNNVIVLTPDSHSQAAALTFNKNMTHLVGAYPAAMMNLRSRIGHSDDFDALLTLSGYGNLLQNLYFMHGRGSATNLHCMEITGDRNTLKNVHLGGPMNQTEADTAGYSVLELTGAKETYLKDCVLGIETMERGAANTILRLGADSSRNIFENCLFLSMADANTPYFIEILVGLTYGWTLFKNCLFINHSTSWGSDLTVAVKQSSTNHRLIFDSKCAMFGVTDVVAEADEAEMWIAAVPYAAAAVGNLLKVTPDHTA